MYEVKRVKIPHVDRMPYLKYTFSWHAETSWDLLVENLRTSEENQPQMPASYLLLEPRDLRSEMLMTHPGAPRAKIDCFQTLQREDRNTPWAKCACRSRLKRPCRVLDKNSNSSRNQLIAFRAFLSCIRKSEGKINVERHHELFNRGSSDLTL